MEEARTGNLKTIASVYLCKMRGGRCTELASFNLKGLSITATGSLLSIGVIAWLSSYYQLPLLIPSFGASAVLLYGACHVPMAQPRNVLGGHMISALAGVITYYFLGSAWWSIAVGVTTAIILMSLTSTLHPPGGATAFLAVYSGQHFSFVFWPIGIVALFLIVVGLLVNNLLPERKYPQYWF